MPTGQHHLRLKMIRIHFSKLSLIEPNISLKTTTYKIGAVTFLRISAEALFDQVRAANTKLDVNMSQDTS